jgi:predicted nucleic acid-binding protein
MIVIADTTPLNYLVLIGESELHPTLYGGVVIPTAVLMELRARGAPAPVLPLYRRLHGATVL